MTLTKNSGITLLIVTLFFTATVNAQPRPTNGARIVPIANGWAQNQVNAVIFRKHSLVTHGKFQYAAFYGEQSRVVVAKRRHGSKNWEIAVTKFIGNTADAHNAISIAVDGDGYLHMAWDHHNSMLKYARSISPGVLDFEEPWAMTGEKETRVSYPEFYNLPGGHLLFLYRDGGSGRGDLVMNRYDVKSKKWTRLQDNLISGEGKRNAYWQTSVDERGTIHVSWVWRESPDVASNHDMCYARSHDGGKTWEKSNGEKYQLPITAATAEYAWRVPQKSELINQTSMTVDAQGRPYIATYWRPEGTTVPQYFVVYFNGAAWKATQVTQRTKPFTLSGGGTKRIPISRPQILASDKKVHVIFRDIQRDERVSVASTSDIGNGKWQIKDLTLDSVGMWEPTFDPLMWAREKKLHLLVQRVGQGDGEKLEDLPPQMISVLEWKP